MRAFNIRSGFAAAAILFATQIAADLDPIVIKGSKFFYKTNGTEFFIKGVAYQQDFSSNGSISGDNKYTDPLADEKGCTRDIPLLQELQTNTIRVYAVDPSKDHTACMNMLQDAGIYVIADLGEPLTSINRDNPQWNLEIYARYTSVVDAFQKYTNLLGFFAGNEVSNAPNNTEASAFVKAAVRDVKKYISDKKYRPIGVGYATNDDDTRTNLANYFNCGPPEDSIDFWGYNIYSWCGDSSLKDSHYTERTEEFSSYNVPAFFAEYGCITVRPRKFSEVPALFGSSMTPVWSGGILYMYFQEANDYGLVTLGSDDKATKLPDFTAYSKQIVSVKPTGVASASESPSNSAQACPSIGKTWEAVEKLPPSPNEAICSCMVQNLTCVAKSDLSDEDIKTQFDFICDPAQGDNCGAIDADPKTGVYGAYSMCKAVERLSKAFDTYYQDQVANNPQNTSPCDFKGAASKQKPQLPSSCQAAVSQAGPAGTGVITSAPSGTGTGSGSSSTTSSKKSAGSVVVPSFGFGFLQLAAYVAAAVLTGAGMILL